MNSSLARDCARRRRESTPRAQAVGGDADVRRAGPGAAAGGCGLRPGGPVGGRAVRAAHGREQRRCATLAHRLRDCRSTVRGRPLLAATSLSVLLALAQAARACGATSRAAAACAPTRSSCSPRSCARCCTARTSPCARTWASPSARGASSRSRAFAVDDNGKVRRDERGRRVARDALRQVRRVPGAAGAAGPGAHQHRVAAARHARRLGRQGRRHAGARKPDPIGTLCSRQAPRRRTCDPASCAGESTQTRVIARAGHGVAPPAAHPHHGARHPRARVHLVRAPGAPSLTPSRRNCLSRIDSTCQLSSSGPQA